MKTDLGLQMDVDEELSFDPSVDATLIGVAAKNGVITLTGKVGNYAEKVAAERAAKRVSGVKGVALGIEIELPAFHQRSDAEIVAAALNVLEWEITLLQDVIAVTVENGWLTLEGRVNWQFLKANAEQAVSNLTGVVGISNLIVVAQHGISPGDVTEKIRQTFEKSHADQQI